VPGGLVRADPDARLDVIMKLLEPVLDNGPGLTGDFTPGPLPVGPEPEADHASPSALAVPVPFAVTARGSVFEEDAVLAPAATSAHGFHEYQEWGPFSGPFASHTGRWPRCPATKLQVEANLSALVAWSERPLMARVRRRSTVRFRKGARRSEA
jgi:hypothetical protein